MQVAIFDICGQDLRICRALSYVHLQYCSGVAALEIRKEGGAGGQEAACHCVVALAKHFVWFASDTGLTDRLVHTWWLSLLLELRYMILF